MAKVHEKWLNKSIKRVLKEADEKGIAVGTNLEPNIRQEAEIGGYLKGVHVLRLTKGGGFKIRKAKQTTDKSETKPKKKDKPTKVETTSEVKVIKSFRLSPSHIKQLTRIAKRTDKSATEIVEEALDLYFDQRG